jgi:hypothetical protein
MTTRSYRFAVPHGRHDRRVHDAVADEREPAACFGGDCNVEVEAIRRQGIRDSFRPLHERPDAGARAGHCGIVPANLAEVVETAEPIEIGMHDVDRGARCRGIVKMDEAKRGAHDLRRINADSRCHGLHERRLACTEVAMESDKSMGGQAGCESCGELSQGRLIGNNELIHRNGLIKRSR